MLTPIRAAPNPNPSNVSLRADSMFRQKCVYQFIELRPNKNHVRYLFFSSRWNSFSITCCTTSKRRESVACSFQKKVSWTRWWLLVWRKATSTRNIWVTGNLYGSMCITNYSYTINEIPSRRVKGDWDERFRTYPALDHFESSQSSPVPETKFRRSNRPIPDCRSKTWRAHSLSFCSARAFRFWFSW